MKLSADNSLRRRQCPASCVLLASPNVWETEVIVAVVEEEVVAVLVVVVEEEEEVVVVIVLVVVNTETDYSHVCKLEQASAQIRPAGQRPDMVLSGNTLAYWIQLRPQR
ncbi:hypothetical protein ElyMa_000382700 [Elysia marginata]|uniref:Uncharacterized protein n=1 Tax=Elysia marginata TaxID=1093978 RepID=A0AAV4FH36_9GAST|nr:hypothetical protein ElyMa_000382700 [Elysia marginata]